MGIRRLVKTASERFVAGPRAGLADYALAAGGVAIAALIRALSELIVGLAPNFPIFYPPVLIATLVGGVRPGLFGVGLSALVVWWFWSPQLHGFPLDRAQLVTMLMFVLTASLMVVVAEMAREATRRAIAAEEQFRKALETSLDAFAILAPIRDGSGRVIDFQWTEANAAARAMMPRDVESLIGKRLLEVFPDAAERGQLRRYTRLLETGEPDQVEFYRPIDGVDRWLRSSGVKIGDAIGLTFRDTTAVVEGRRTLEARVAERTRALEDSLAERARAEAALAQAQRLETVGRLTGGVAHDFNNLLTVIVGGLDMILRAPDHADRVARMARAALDAARRGERLTRQLLAFSRHQELKLEAADVAPALARIEPLIRRAAGEDIVLTIGAADDVGAAKLDTAQFEAALLNLVVNAAQATPPGGAIAIRARREALTDGEIIGLAAGDYLAISVADTGVGMPPDVLARVFEPFFTTKEVGKGTGLGLAQVYGFARQCGGLATVESQVGHGTTFTLHLPAAEGAGAMLDAAEPAISVDRAFANGATVLLVEDDPDVRALTETLLMEFGCRVLTAEDGPSALAMLERGEAVQLLLSDVVMPGGMSGVDLARASSRLRPDLPIMLATGYAAGRLADRALDGAWPVLRKPYRMEDLALAVGRALKGEKPLPAVAPTSP